MASSITSSVVSVRYIDCNYLCRNRPVRRCRSVGVRPLATLRAMSFDPRRARGADGGAAGSLPGEIDYRLARQSLISEFKKGRIDRQEVCDAQTELMRAARNVGEPSNRLCPICEDSHVVLVTYVFGPRMPASGKCVTTK